MANGNANGNGSGVVVARPLTADLTLARTRGELTGLRAELAQKDQEIEFLLDQVRDRVGPAVSTALTFSTAALAGFMDGFLGEDNKFGPVPITGMVAFTAAIASVAIEDPDAAEATAALARGMGAPFIYEWVKKATEQHFQEQENVKRQKKPLPQKEENKKQEPAKEPEPVPGQKP